MSKIFIPFVEMVPDKGLFANQNIVYTEGFSAFSGALIPESEPYPLLKAENFIPLGMGYIGDNSLALAMQDRGSVPDEQTKLYLISLTSKGLTEVEEVGRDPVTEPYSLGYTWRFQPFGNSLIATNGDNSIQRLDLSGVPLSRFFEKNNVTTAPAPSLVETADPRAQFVIAVKSHIVLANCSLMVVTDADGEDTGGSYGALDEGDDLRDMVWISALDDPTRFADPDTHPNIIGSDYQRLLDDYGPITGAVGGEDAYFFKERAIYYMEGPPWTFKQIANQDGTLYNTSIVRVGDDIYFWSKSGPAVIRGGKVVHLGTQKINTLLRSEIGLRIPWGYLNGTSWADVEDGLAMNDHLGGPREWAVMAFACPDSSSVSWRITKGSTGIYVGNTWVKYDQGFLLTYNYEQDSWTISSVRCQENETVCGATYPEPLVEPSSGSIFFPAGISDASDFSQTEDNNSWAGLNGALSIVWSYIDASTPMEPVPVCDVIIAMNMFNRTKECALTTGYIQLDEESETVIQRIRPIFQYSPDLWNTGASNHPTVNVWVHSVQNPVQYLPYAAANATGNVPWQDGSLTTFNIVGATDREVGWIPMSSLIAGDFHRIAIKFGSRGDNDMLVSRFYGIEVQFKKVTKKGM